MLVGFDTETHLIRPGLLTPPIVCVSWAHDAIDLSESITSEGFTRQTNREDRNLWSGLLRHDQSLPFVEELLDTEDIILVGAHIAYDMGVIAAKWPPPLRKVFDAYDAGRIRDVLIRQKLLDIAAGCYRGYFDERGQWTQFNYSLDDLSQRFFDTALDKGENSWRLRYAELENVPLANWPEAALVYPCEDTVTPLLVHAEQETCRYASED